MNITIELSKKRIQQLEILTKEKAFVLPQKLSRKERMAWAKELNIILGQSK